MTAFRPATAVFAAGTLPMMVKARRTRDVRSYSLGNIALGNLGNLLYAVYVLHLPLGPIWALHTFHTITDLYDSGVLGAIVFFREMDGRRFSDVADNALYWHFIVWSWVLLYLVVYWTPRWT